MVTGERPGYLQDHSMVEYQNKLYVFGGEISFCNDQEIPLWIFDIEVGAAHCNDTADFPVITRQIHGREKVAAMEENLRSHCEVIPPQCTKNQCSYLVDIKI